MSERIHLSKAEVTEVEETLILEALRSGWVAPLGPFVDRFEAEMAERVGVSSALALSSGTAALHLALIGAGVGPGSTVVLPTLTFVATANAVLYTGATPVFVDAREDDANLDTGLMIEAIRTLRRDGADVAAAISVDLFGNPCDYTTLEPALAELEVPLIEDAAEALGARHRGRAAGSFGASAALSFNGNKIMTTSGGGMLLSNDTELVARARYLSTQARQPVRWYEHTEMGFNYRLSNILAALGVGQLARLDDLVARRRDIRQRYEHGLADVPGLWFIGGEETSETTSNYWLTSVVLDPDVIQVSPDEVMHHLERDNIEARPIWKPMHEQPVFAGTRSFLTGVAGRLFAQGLNLPSGAGLGDADIDRVIVSLRTALGADGGPRRESRTDRSRQGQPFG